MNDFTKVAARAARQAGVISRAQLAQMKISADATRWAVDSGRLAIVRRGVYRLTGAPETREQRLWAALLAAGPGAVISHTSAAWLLKLDGLGLHQPDEIDVSIAGSRSISPIHGVRTHRVARLDMRRDTFLVNGVACTNLPRTVVDLSGQLEATQLEAALDSALRRSPKMKQAISEALVRAGGTRGRRGTQLLEALISNRPLGASGGFNETRFRKLVKVAGLPEPMVQVAINDDDGRQIGVFDFVWHQYSLVVLAQSWRWHGSQAAQEKDERQRSALAAAGWQVLGYTARRVKAEPHEVLAELRRAMANGKPIPL